MYTPSFISLKNHLYQQSLEISVFLLTLIPILLWRKFVPIFPTVLLWFTEICRQSSLNVILQHFNQAECLGFICGHYETFSVFFFSYSIVDLL